ncbi:MAG: carbohydrate ABC transporter permease [Microbacterium sp.]
MTVVTPRRPLRRRLRAFAPHLPLALVAVGTIFPFYVMVMLSMRGGQQITLPGALVPAGLSFDAYEAMLGNPDLGRWMLNTLLYSVISVVLVLLISTTAAYVFAKKRFPGRTVLFWLIMSTMMVPYHLTLIPQFLMISKMNGVDTLWGLIAPTLVNMFALFLMRQFIAGVPDELFEAARMDGAGEWRIFFRILLPQLKPVMATLSVFVFLWHWNDFLWPLVVTRTPGNYVITVGLLSMFAKDASMAQTMAGAVITFVPIVIVYLILQKYFERGTMTSGMK